MSAGDALLAALRVKAGVDFAAQVEATPWCSMGRSGERHRLTLTFPIAASAARLLAGLDDHRFALPDAYVADIHAQMHAAADGHVRVELEALTLPLD